MRARDYSYFIDLMRQEYGLVLTPEKIASMKSRLAPMAQRHGLESVQDLEKALRQGSPDLLRAMVDAILPSEAAFFQDRIQFGWLKEKIIPAYVQKRAETKELQIWSAGCSSGQEPYSIAMTIVDSPALADWDCKIDATDISQELVDAAQDGLYSQIEVQRGLPTPTLVRHFKKEDKNWRAGPKIRTLVWFEQANLLESEKKDAYDIIFCRHVLSSFDAGSRETALKNLHAALRIDGVLFLAPDEGTDAAPDLFRPVAGMSGVYLRSDVTYWMRMHLHA